MNFSLANNQLRQYNVPNFVDFTPGSAMTKKADGLAMISIIVAVFVLLAILIIMTVHYGPQLRTVQITLVHDPMPQDMENGTHLTHWKKLGSQRKCNMPCVLTLENNGASGMNLQSGSGEPNIIEITYL
ncbi:small integral membrane protein 33 [Hemicordylus capensis]|uniref:small integral membrane protein 33 n=1 Tax=Hemicordylus capensis TaxID=884348 RepID=UPI0023037C03|nr:small integral membrane protein 33 [Hemicordylus capensis]